MRELSTDIEIAAPAARVWRHLTDFAAYPEWNPFIRRAEGTLRPGARLRVYIQPPGGRGMFAGHRIGFGPRERFSGVLVPLVWRTLDRDTRRGFEAMNAALKARAEAQEASRPGRSGGLPVNGEDPPNGRR